MDGDLKVALPKGKLFDESASLFRKIGFSIPKNFGRGRKLWVTDRRTNTTFHILRNKDLPFVVESGMCDLGIVGRDILIEYPCSLYEVLSLGFGQARFSLATMEGNEKNFIEKLKSGNAVIATKYPSMLEQFLKEEGLKAKIISFSGSVEIAPSLGLCDGIADLVSTGKTLEENKLREVKTFFTSEAYLVVNRWAMKWKHSRLIALIKKIEGVIKP